MVVHGLHHVKDGKDNEDKVEMRDLGGDPGIETTVDRGQIWQAYGAG